MGNIETYIYNGICDVEVMLFIAGMVSVTFPFKKSIKKGIIQWFIVMIITFGVTSISYYGGSYFNNYMLTLSESSESLLYTQVLYMAITFYQVLLNTLPAIIAIIAVIWINQAKVRTKIFISSFFLLLMAAISQFIAEVTIIFFCTENDGYEKYLANPWTGVSIDGICLLIGFLLYYKFLRGKINHLLDTGEKQVSSCAVVACVSYVAFEICKQTLQTYGITFTSVDPGNFLIAVIILLSLLIIYCLMYWAIFRSVIIGTDAAKVKAELDVAGHIQASALPSKFPAFPKRNDFDIYASMNPAKEVGGDFYDFFLIDDNHLAVLIADVSGKGVPAALFMMSGQAIIKNQAMIGIEPGKIFKNANNQLAENNEEGMFITAFFGIIDLQTGEFDYCNAGHNVPYICRKDGTVEELPIKPGFVLAGLKNIKYKTDHIVLEPDEKLVLYTDGVTEAIDPDENMYTEQRLIDVLKMSTEKSVKQIVEEINTSVNVFADTAEQFDDITVLVVKRNTADAVIPPLED